MVSLLWSPNSAKKDISASFVSESAVHSPRFQLERRWSIFVSQSVSPSDFFAWLNSLTNSLLSIRGIRAGVTEKYLDDAGGYPVTEEFREPRSLFRGFHHFKRGHPGLDALGADEVGEFDLVLGYFDAEGFHKDDCTASWILRKVSSLIFSTRSE